VAAQVKFERLDASKVIPGQYDLITTLDIIHDAVDPCGLLRMIREALRSGGTHLSLDINCSGKPEDNTGPLPRSSTDSAWCMTTSLAQRRGGAGHVWVARVQARELALAAGLAVCESCHRKIRSTIYEVKP
jgi:hypothetical protein